MKFAARRYVLALLVTVGCTTTQPRKAPVTTDLTDESTPPTPLLYEIDLTDQTDDRFKVTLTVNDLTATNAVYHFAATAPGTYQTMDIGRFVHAFSAYDQAGAAIATEQISTNQWRIADPASVNRLSFEVSDVWDTPVSENEIYPMTATSLEEDHALINPHAVFGFPQGMQGRPLGIKLRHPEGWMVGTALEKNAEGYYMATDYDHAVDSPILLGRLSKAVVDVGGTDVEIYTYSKTDKVKSEQIVDAVRDILFATDAFLGGLPVDRYAFLFHFEDATYGAWEHSYSSEYIFREDDFARDIQANIPSVVAHEFFHIVTPLSIHSQIIERFNFEQPIPSEHLWFYEGVTEWASDIIQLRAQLLNLDQFFATLSEKMHIDEAHDRSISLSELALTSYTPKGQQQYVNIYHRGSLVATLLDIKLLELSEGALGLRELILDLAERYGPDRPFEEARFFETIASLTYPEMADFFVRYVQNAETLPIAAYFDKIGISYRATVNTGRKVPFAGLRLLFREGNIVVAAAEGPAEDCGIETGDAVRRLAGVEMSLETAGQAMRAFQSVEAGAPYLLTVERDGVLLDRACEKTLREQIDRHVFAPDPDAGLEQLRLRDAWMNNRVL